MIKEKEFTQDNIKEIRLNWDFENVIFPRQVIKKFSCHYNHDKINYLQDAIYLENAYLEVDLDFVLNEYSYFDFKKSENKKNIDCLKFNNVWYITVTTNDDKEYELEVPFYDKSFYLDKDTNVYNTKNIFEHHEQQNKSYIIEWKEDSTLTKLTIDEMSELFKNKKKKGAPINNHNFQVEVFNQVLKKKDETRRIEILKSFCDIINGNIKIIKNNYQITTIIREEENFSLCTLNIKNHSYVRNINYIFIKNDHDWQNIIDLLEKKSGGDTSHSWHKNIFIINDEVSLKSFEKYLASELEDYFMDNIICISLKELNQIWYEMLHLRMGI